MLTTTVVDYGVGNLFSVKAALQHCGVDKVIFAKDEEEILKAEKLILPGVGAFSDAMNGLKSEDLIRPIKDFVKTGKPLMGICLGMQMLGTQSEEFGIHQGLDFIPGKVIKIPQGSNECQRKVPFVGWAELNTSKSGRFKSNILSQLPDNSAVYLVHSYQFVAEKEEDVIAYYDYQDLKVCAAIQHENIIGFQFHPEKSSNVGLNILNSFLHS
tara:strand:+ start:770 stop:1408 length:639 start_codon:yes stop_codon:yes gene_type:complete